MGSVDRHREAHAVFNKRDWDAMGNIVAAGCQYEDHPRGLTMKNGDEFVGWLQEWEKSFSDASVDDVEYLDAGDWSIARFHGRGTNDGQLGPMPATNGRMDMNFCELIHWDTDGKMDRGEIYYDQVTMLTQLGVMEPPPAG